MRVDIIIPTYKPDDTFCLLLQKLQEQTFVIHELILVNTEEALWNEAVTEVSDRTDSEGASVF